MTQSVAAVTHRDVIRSSKVADHAVRIGDPHVPDEREEPREEGDRRPYDTKRIPDLVVVDKQHGGDGDGDRDGGRIS